PRRNIFYSPSMLRDLGWPADADRVEAVRSSFADLRRLPAKQLMLSTFSLEHDTIVSPSILLDDVGELAVETRARSFTDGAVVLSDAARAWAAHRVARPADAIGGGRTAALARKAYAVSSLERYQDCPFKFFASDVLQLDELPEDEAALSPRARGRFVHEVFQRFFEAWDRRPLDPLRSPGPSGGSITSDTIDSARAVFAGVAEPL